MRITHDRDQKQLSKAESLPAGKVLIVCPGGLEHGGGIGRQMGYFLEARTADRAALTYEVVDSRGPWFLGASPFHIGLAVFYLLAAAGRLLSARVGSSASIAHINITGRGSTLRKIVLCSFADLIGLRYLLHVHDYNYYAEYERRGAVVKFLMRRLFHRAARVLVLGMREQEKLAKLLALPIGQVSVFHNAVPDPRPSGMHPRREGKPCHVLFLGHLSARKGVPELLRALASPALTGRDWRATLAGGGPIDEFHLLATSLGIADRIEFPGWVDQPRVRALCADAEILVLPSHAEGLAMAVLEGLSNGLAVITTPVGAHSEVIEEEVSGILVPPGDVDALANALRRVMDDAGLRDRLRDGARHRFHEKFDVRGYAEQLCRLHVEILSELRDVRSVVEERAS